MRRSSGKDFSVFNFSEEDEAIESSSRDLAKKFKSRGNRKPNKPEICMYTFLEKFAKGTSDQQAELKDVVCIDYDENDGDHKCGAVDISDRAQEILEVDVIVSSPSRIPDQSVFVNEDCYETGDFMPKCLSLASLGARSLGVSSIPHSRLNCSFMDLASNQEKLVDVISGDNESLKECLLSTSVNYPNKHEGFLGCTTMDYCHVNDSGMEKKANLEIVISPDFLFYGNRVSTWSQLTFSSGCVKLEVSNDCDMNDSSYYEWAVDDIVYIECRHSKNVDVACLKLRLKTTAAKGVENRNDNFAISTLVFAVNDPNWQEREQLITSLDESYKSKWNPINCSEMADEDDDFMGQKMMFSLKRYLYDFDGPLEDVIYPKGDPDAICISKGDVELLQPETFINDTIIDFYMKYLEKRIQPKKKLRFHFFNSFFFPKLVALDKSHEFSSDGTSAFLRVRKWTRKVNIFEKDYIFIPINFNLHWSLIVVCHPSEIPYFTGDNIKKASRVPCILHMDSIKGSHRGLKNLFQSYLWEEWKERHECSDDVSLRFSNLRFIPLELPQQENSFDCGLFLLHYVELFLEDAPYGINPFKITKFSNFLTSNWFPPAEASHKRSAIRKLIHEIVDDTSIIGPPVSCSNQSHSQFRESDSDKEVVECIPEYLPTKKTCLGNILSNVLDNGLHVKLPTLSSAAGVQFFKETDDVSSKCYKCQKESIETNEQFVSPSEDKVQSLLQDGIRSEMCATSYSAKDMCLVNMSPHEIVTELEEYGEWMGSSTLCLNCESTNSSEVGVSNSRDFVNSNEVADVTSRLASQYNRWNIPETSSMALSDSHFECVVEDSPERDSRLAESKESQESFFSCREHLAPSSIQDVESGENFSTSDNVHVISSNFESRPKQELHKRKKSLSLVGERRRTRNMSKACLL